MQNLDTGAQASRRHNPKNEGQRPAFNWSALSRAFIYLLCRRWRPRSRVWCTIIMQSDRNLPYFNKLILLKTGISHSFPQNLWILSQSIYFN